MTMRQTRIALALAIILAGCSKAQLSNVADAFCRGLENCTVYDENGNPSHRDWKPPVDRR
jgi:PBP1b-binding outer membrane lipoprotein LpoB